MSNKLQYENESEVMRLLENGDGEALKLIYQKYWKRLYLSAYNILKDKEASEDIVQEVFVQLWQRKDTLTISTSISAYLFAATRYQVFHYIRKASGRPALYEDLEDRFQTEAPDIPLYTKELQQKINDAVESLPEKCREIYRLSREQHLTYKAIAAKLQVSPKTVENQISIALKKLREALGDFMVFII